MISKCYKCETYFLFCLIKNGLCPNCKRIYDKNKFEFEKKRINEDLKNLEEILRNNPDKIYHYLAWCAIHTNVDNNYSY